MQAALLALALAAAPATLKVLTYDVLYTANPVAAVETIARSQADVVCLQGLTPELAKAFQRKLGKRYPNRRLEARVGTWGVGLASRLTLEDVTVFPARPTRLPAISAVVRKGKKRVVVQCVHLWPPLARRDPGDGPREAVDGSSEVRRDQVRQLLRRLAAETRPALIVGDLNELESDRAIRQLRSAGFIPACDAPEQDCGGTWPGASSMWPAVFRVDNVLGRGVTFTNAAVIREGPSDHYPLLAEVRW